MKMREGAAPGISYGLPLSAVTKRRVVQYGKVIDNQLKMDDELPKFHL